MTSTSKMALRNKMKSLYLPISQISKFSEIIYKRIIQRPEYKTAKNILLYYSIKNEVDTKKLIEHSLKVKKNVFLPFVSKIAFGQIFALEELTKESNKIKIPDSETLLSANILDLIIVPGIAFDKNGNRLGHGTGWYDKLLSKTNRERAQIIGLAFNYQVCEEIPTDEHDQKINLLITEDQVIDFKQSVII